MFQGVKALHGRIAQASNESSIRKKGVVTMNTGISKTHPMIVIAATAVLLTCLLAIGVMTGIVPSPMNRGADKQELTTGPAANTSTATTSLRESTPSGTTTTTRESRTVTRPAAPARERSNIADRTPPAPAAGATAGSGASQSVAGSGAAAPAACSNCGTVTSVRAVTQQGEAGMIGPAAGALLGGVLGRQIGSGSGQTIATVAGAGVGAAAGTEVERRYKSSTHYVVNVRMNDGNSRSFNYASAPGVQAGSKVRVVDGQLVHD
jgi:outer membrane lipoprotein SlyB